MRDCSPQFPISGGCLFLEPYLIHWFASPLRVEPSRDELELAREPRAIFPALEPSTNLITCTTTPSQSSPLPPTARCLGSYNYLQEKKELTEQPQSREQVHIILTKNIVLNLFPAGIERTRLRMQQVMISKRITTATIG